MSKINQGLADFLDDEMGGSDIRIGIKNYLDTGVPELNYALTGNYQKGIPGGRMVEIFGPSGCGKTFLATMVMAAAQRAGGIAAFSDHERTFEPVLAQSLGLSLDADKYLYKRPRTFEESVNMAMTFCEKIRVSGMIPDDAPLVWVFDSVASMIPHEKLFDDKGNRRDPKSYNMRDQLLLAKATSQTYPSLAQFSEDFNMTPLMLNQIRMKPGVLHGDPTTVPGGNAPEFYASQRISLGKKMITNGKKGPDREELGFLISAKVVKNKVARPYLKAHWQVRFNEGLGVTLDHVATLVDFLKRKGLLESAGNRVVWDGKKLFESVLVAQLREEPDAVERLMALVPDTDQELEDVVKAELALEMVGEEKA